MMGKQGLDRRDVLPKLVQPHHDFLIIAGLAGTGKDIGGITQEASNAFIFGGAMGGTSMTALGVALSQPDRRVLAVMGDGDLLMSMGSLATIALAKPKNLALLCVDNGAYGETGNQESHTKRAVDLSVVAKACGFSHSCKIESEHYLEGKAELLRAKPGPLFVLLKVAPGPPTKYERNWRASECADAFRRNLEVFRQR